jgi:hypothetical protein
MTEPANQNPCPEPITCVIAVELANLRGELGSELKALAENVKALKASSEIAFMRGEKIMDEHDDRIGRVERKIWFASGMAAAMSAAATAFLTKIFGGDSNG